MIVVVSVVIVVVVVLVHVVNVVVIVFSNTIGGVSRIYADIFKYSRVAKASV